MKRLAVFGILIVLFTASTAALADNRGHGKKYDNQHYQHKSHKNGHKYGHKNRHYKRGRYAYKYYRPYRGRRYYGGYYRPHYYFPDYVGAALIGSALTYSLYHTHNGAYCYDNHGDNNYQQRSYSEVVGCHRMERLPDGSERRLEVPL